MASALRTSRLRVLDDNDAIRSHLPADRAGRPPIVWGNDRLGVGLLLALRAKTSIVFEDAPSPDVPAPTKSGHLVVCEAGNDLAQAVAANYAYALRAGLIIVPKISEADTERLLDTLYQPSEHDLSTSTALASAKAEFRRLCPEVAIPLGGSLTFFTRKLPLGLGFPEAPSTHIFTYPDAGLAVINGFAASQASRRGDNVALLIDPETTAAPEIEAAAKSLSKRGMFVRAYRGPAANVRDVSNAVELFPYNLVVFATHCGDAGGYRSTYEFNDAGGRPRKLVVDIALGIGRPDRDKRLSVTQFMRFHELDGVGWTDAEKKKALPVGTAIADFITLTREPPEIEPTVRTTIPRVIGSAAMKMHDNNYIPLPRSLADNETPFVLNNACVSWHELAGRFTFGGARAYIGTLIEVTEVEAQEVVTRLLGKHFDKMLPHAIWSAQNEIYGASVRRPYVMTGVYTQRLQPTQADTPNDIITKLTLAKRAWERHLAHARKRNDARTVENIAPIAEYYANELVAMTARWRDG